jgi:hypothetical protein
MCPVCGLSGPDQAFDRPLKALPKFSRQHGAGLRHIDLEGCIESRIEVD